jgi:hypothetical protein
VHIEIGGTESPQAATITTQTTFGYYLRTILNVLLLLLGQARLWDTVCRTQAGSTAWLAGWISNPA